MNEYKRQSSGHECPPNADDPAPQPPAPKKCEPLKETKPPTLDRPNECPPPSADCNCPPKKAQTPSCLEDLSTKQDEAIAAADRAKTFKAAIDALQAKAKAASLEYTRDKYDKLVKQWIDQDRDIADLIRRLVCAVPCWKCVIDCYVCPLLADLHNDEKWLNGDWNLYDKVYNLYDLRYWCTRDKENKAATFTRIEKVLAVWEKPAQTLEKALNDVKALIDAANKAIGTEPGKVVYDVFLRLVPLHLAIAPPEAVATTKIDREYTDSDLCPCDKRDPDDCCGPDVGRQSLRQRLVGLQPYLVDPSDYFDLICCLVTQRYAPAKEALAKAEAALAGVEKNIATINARIDAALKSFEKDVKAAIPSEIKCCDEQLPKDEPKSSSTAR